MNFSEPAAYTHRDETNFQLDWIMRRTNSANARCGTARRIYARLATRGEPNKELEFSAARSRRWTCTAPFLLFVSSDLIRYALPASDVRDIRVGLLLHYIKLCYLLLEAIKINVIKFLTSSS